MASHSLNQVLLMKEIARRGTSSANNLAPPDVPPQWVAHYVHVLSRRGLIELVGSECRLTAGGEQTLARVERVMVLAELNGVAPLLSLSLGDPIGEASAVELERRDDLRTSSR